MRLNHPESDAQVWRSPKHTEDLSVLPAFTGTHWQAFFLILKSWLLMPFNYQITSAETNQLRNLVIWVRCRWTVVCSAQQMSEKETATTASSPVSYYSTGWFLRWSCHFWHFFKMWSYVKESYTSKSDVVLIDRLWKNNPCQSERFRLDCECKRDTTKFRNWPFYLSVQQTFPEYRNLFCTFLYVVSHQIKPNMSIETRSKHRPSHVD